MPVKIEHQETEYDHLLEYIYSTPPNVGDMIEGAITDDTGTTLQINGGGYVVMIEEHWSPHRRTFAYIKTLASVL